MQSKSLHPLLCFVSCWCFIKFHRQQKNSALGNREFLFGKWQYSASDEILHDPWNPQVHYIDHKSLTLYPVLSQLNPVHTLTFHIFKIYICNDFPPKHFSFITFPDFVFLWAFHVLNMQIMSMFHFMIFILSPQKLRPGVHRFLKIQESPPNF